MKRNFDLTFQAEYIWQLFYACYRQGGRKCTQLHINQTQENAFFRLGNFIDSKN
jgi:hypothetical protein